jgi:hypothetical protein
MCLVINILLKTTLLSKSNKRSTINRLDVFEKLSDFQKTGIQRSIHEEFRKLNNRQLETYPTMKSIYEKLKMDPSLPKMGLTRCRYVLLRLGFRFNHVWNNDNALLLESAFIVKSRRVFIQKIRKYR